MPTEEALRLAGDARQDLVEVSPTERPPVCKIMDYGKHKYVQSKKQRQKHHEQKLKEVRLRPKTDPHDKGIKLNRARSFLEQGNRVQFTMLFRGRERFHKEVGLKIFHGIVASLEDVAKVERPPIALGRRMTMILVPSKVGGSKKPKPTQTTGASEVERATAAIEPVSRAAKGPGTAPSKPADTLANTPATAFPESGPPGDGSSRPAL